MTDRVGLGLLATGLTLTLCYEAKAPTLTKAPAPAEAPVRLHQGSSEAPPGLRRTTEIEAQHCAETWYKTGVAPTTINCNYVEVDADGNDLPIYEDDMYGRWNCQTMGNRICGPKYTYIALTG